MRLYEFETKALMLQEGISVPQGVFTNNPAKVAEFVEKVGKSVVKAQTLVGRRMEAGGIRFVNVPVQGELASEMLFDTEIHNEEVIGVRVEEFVPIKKEYYVSLYYDSETRSLMLSFSLDGGKNIESSDNPANISTIELPINQDIDWRLRKKPVLVYPTLHYQNGGLKINSESETTVRNLYAVGENVGGIHGHNRLMGNSLLELFVFGKLAGKQAAARASSCDFGETSLRHLEEFEYNRESNATSPLLLPDYIRKDF